MTSTLFYGGTILTLNDCAPRAEWLVAEGGEIASVGEGADLPPAHLRVDLEGAVLVPGFCDAHVHMTATGLSDLAIDLSSCRSPADVSTAFRYAGGTADLMLGVNLRAEVGDAMSSDFLDDGVGDRPAMAAQTDLHSVVASTALLAELTRSGAVAGGRTGILREKDAAAAWRWLDASLTGEQLRRALDAATTRALSRGVTEAHEMFVLEWRGWRSFDEMTAYIPSLPIRLFPFVSTTDLDAVVARGLGCVGGDLFLDGSFGSCTAWLREPYDAGPCAGATGMSYRTDEDVVDLFTRAQDLRLQTAVHAIGDAAIEQAISAWEAVARAGSLAAVRAGGHRIEHFECADDDHIKRAAALGLRASVQPAFDRFWGGPSGLYSERIGWTRAKIMNRFNTMRAAGIVVGAGSDSTVTPLDPFIQMAALMAHHLPEERMTLWDAMLAHTRGSHLLGGDGRGGLIAPGEPADFAVLDADPTETGPDDLADIRVLSTWVTGRCVWES